MTKIKNTLIILESPNKTKNVSKYLGPGYVVRASYGHIYDLASGGQDGIGVDVYNNFKLKFKLISNKKDKLQAIIDAANDVEEIIIATDGDREGESIAADLAEALASCKASIKRAVFTEITAKGILQGMKNLRTLDLHMVDAQRARRALDRIVGYLVSPYVINSFGPNLSAGRVQSVAVKLIVDREREIENFKPEEYWNINATLAKSGSKESFVAKYNNKVKIQDKKTADKIKADLEEASYQVTEVEEEERKRNPYPPLITSSLASTAAGRYKFAAARTMKAAQSLYETGLITYMRTDSFRISPEALESCREWLKSKSYEIPSKANIYIKGGGAQDAHEAIRPTDVAKLPENIYVSEDEKKIYKLIWERFVTSQMKPAVYDTVSATIETSNKHILRANGRVLKYKGWLEITGEDEDDIEETSKLPPLKKGDSLFLVPPKVKAEQKFTQPPPRFSEKTLIKELEKRRIGRPSTYASIMSKITDRNYVVEKSSMFHATDLGKKVLDSLVKFFDFVNYDYTAEMEQKLDKIAEGTLNYQGMMNDFYNPFAEQLKKAYVSNKKDYGFKCDTCQEMMELKHGRFGFYMACINYPSCKNTFSCEIVDDKPVRKENFQNLVVVEGVKCPKCGLGMTKRDGKFGPFYSCIDIKCKGTSKVPFGKKCSRCNNELYLTIFNEQFKLACMGYPDCRNIEEVPAGTQNNWKNPSQVKEPKLTKSLEKIIASEKSKAVSRNK